MRDRIACFGFALLLSFGGASSTLAQGYGPGCPWPAPAPEVLPSTTPLLFAAVRWCGIAEAPTMVDPNTYTCRPDPKFAMWGRHERASDGILIPQAKITLRSGAVGGHTAFKIFEDPHYTIDPVTLMRNYSVGVAGDVVIVPTTEIDEIWDTCDRMWGGPTPQPKGVMVISAYHLLTSTGREVGLGFGIVGTITRPYIVVADPDVGHEINERALAYWFCRVLNVSPDIIPGSLMNRTERTGVTLSTVQCNEARTYLAANPILDPPGAPTNALARVAATFDRTGDAERPFLDVGKIVTTDASPVRGDLSFCLATRGVVPQGQNTAIYWILLDRDNNPDTGAVPDDLVPGRPMGGVDFVCEVRLQGTNVTATLYEPSEFGVFVPVILSPGLITGAVRQASYIVIEPNQDYTGPLEFPAFSEIDFRIAYAGLAPAGFRPPGAVAAAQEQEGLFPNGLRIQAVAESPGFGGFDLAPDQGEVQRFPKVEFPTLTIPPRIKRGERMPVAVALMPPNVRLKCLLGPQMLPIDVFTGPDGSARFEVTIPLDAVTGPRLVTVGVDDVENAVTADGMVIVDSSATLRISLEQTNARLSWQGSNYVLQATSELPDNWSDVTTLPSTPDDLNYSLLVTPREKKQFYRLRMRD